MMDWTKTALRSGPQLDAKSGCMTLGRALICLLLTLSTSNGQDKFDLASLSQAGNEDPVQLSSNFELKDATNGLLHVTAQLSPGWHIFSTTQPPGASLKTNITVATTGVTLVGVPVPDHEPETRVSVDFGGVVEEFHHDKVVWTAPLRFATSTGNENLQIEVKVRGQVCESSCVPVNKKLVAQFTGAIPGDNPKAESPALDTSPSAKTFRDPKGHVNWTASLSKSKAKVGETLNLVIRAEPDPKYHLYKMMPGDAETNFRTTLVLTEKSSMQFGKVVSSQPAISKDIGGTIYEIHEGVVEWNVPLQISEEGGMGQRPLEGLVGYQACTDDLCDQPLAFRFSGMVEVSQDNSDVAVFCSLAAIDFKEVVKAPLRRTWFQNLDSDNAKQTSAETVAKPNDAKRNDDGEKGVKSAEVLSSAQLGQAFVFAILGGFILNFMPCVLPVIGLKVLAFVEESEGSAKNIAWLNFCYILGIMTVVMILGGMTALANEFSQSFMWGSQFGNQGFRIAILVLVFAMALSFLGVWELPIPGFATGKASNDLLAKEGASGAFFKGVITTILATPCTGPFLGTALSFTLGQPSWIVLLIFFGIGLGISLPFIVIAFFPQSIKWLPKPGAWMDTLKQALAFPLLLTVVFFLTTFSNDYRIAALTMLIGVWFACWWIGKIPVWSERKEKAKGWAGAIVAATALGLFSFYFLGPIEKRIDWRPYNEPELSKLTSEGKIVLIDFTAEWCLNCKANLRTAIDTDKVAALIKSKSVVPMLADMTDFPEHIEQKLVELKCVGIPVLAIYPAGNRNSPIVLTGTLTESTVLKAIQEASSGKKSNGISASVSGSKTR